MSFFEFPNTRTYDNDLGWLIRNAKTQNDAVAALEQFKIDSEAAFAQLNQLLKDIENGNFPEEIANAIRQYITKNFYNIVGDMIRFVWFGLTDSGYFCAYIPDNWKAITFGTTEYDYFTEIQPNFGHLVLFADPEEVYI